MNQIPLIPDPTELYEELKKTRRGRILSDPQVIGDITDDENWERFRKWMNMLWFLHPRSGSIYMNFDGSAYTDPKFEDPDLLLILSPTRKGAEECFFYKGDRAVYRDDLGQTEDTWEIITRMALLKVK